MAVSKAQQKAVTKYVKSNYDRFGLTMPRGKKEIIQTHAEQQGQSVNAYINAAIDEKMSRDDSKAHTAASTGGVVSVYSESENAAPAAHTEGTADGD